MQSTDTDHPAEKAPPSRADGHLGLIAQAMTRMRLLIGRRFIGRLAVSRMDTGLELSDIDAIGVIRRIGPDQEVTVGAVADQLRIDPSRGSRIVAELVKQGYLERAASQEDGRRSILRVTGTGRRVLDQIETIKRETIEEAMAGWSRKDVETFARLYMRFTEGLEAQANRLDQGNSES